MNTIRPNQEELSFHLRNPLIHNKQNEQSEIKGQQQKDISKQRIIIILKKDLFSQLN
jgi:hypothetical protein